MTHCDGESRCQTGNPLGQLQPLFKVRCVCVSAHTCSCMSININPPLFDHLALHSYIGFLEFSHGFCSFQSELGFVFFFVFLEWGGWHQSSDFIC